MSEYRDVGPEARHARTIAMRLVAAAVHGRRSPVYVEELGRAISELFEEGDRMQVTVTALVDALVVVADLSVEMAVIEGSDPLLVLAAIQHAIEEAYGPDF